MRILFIDPIGWQYTPDTPYERPLGGSQSSLCYLSAELARLGHSVTLLNATTTETISRGVTVGSVNAMAAPGYAGQFDICIVLNRPMGQILRRDFGVTIPMILWNQHAADQPEIAPLKRGREQRAWDAISFVAKLHLQEFERLFAVPTDKCRIMRNAVSPAFSDQPLAEPWFVTGKAPVLFYNSTPFRGLDVMLDAFPQIRAAVPDTRLAVYSSLGVYQVASADDPFHQLYERARNMDGVDYVGSVGQARLAQETSGMAALAYPSTFSERFGIIVTEAMVAGPAVFTTNLGALPEVTAGHAAMIEYQPDKAKLTQDFADMAIHELQDARRDPEAALTRRQERIAFARKNYLWSERAKEWAAWIEEVVAKAKAAKGSGTSEQY